MRAPRGQNLVLLALTMLFLALMVTMTIGIGLRIRQKHELQNIADAAAYSNAVMTARTFNNSALINRLEVSYWVALAADQALISWSGYAQGMANGAEVAAGRMSDRNCAPGHGYTPQTIDDFRSAVGDYIASDLETASWLNLDQAAGNEAKTIQGVIGGLRDEIGTGDLLTRYQQHVRAQQLTTAIIANAMRDDVTIIGTAAAPPGGSATAISLREADCDSPGSSSGLCFTAAMNTDMLQAAMGSRANGFVGARSQVPTLIYEKLKDIGGDAVTITSAGKSGSAYWASFENHGALPSTEISWADDHGDVTIEIGDCKETVAVTASLRSTHLVDQSDAHRWTRRPASLEPEPYIDHTMGDCHDSCPSVWVRTTGFMPDNSEANVWGQPKMMVALERDLSKHQYPWELHFKFPFSAGPAGEWDGRGQKLASAQGGGLNIRRQTAISTGIAYYHRSEHWDEFPNLLNPFWRATLVAADVDSALPNRSNDIPNSLPGAEYRWQRDAYRELVGVGYEGLH